MSYSSLTFCLLSNKVFGHACICIKARQPFHSQITPYAYLPMAACICIGFCKGCKGKTPHFYQSDQISKKLSFVLNLRVFWVGAGGPRRASFPFTPLTNHVSTWPSFTNMRHAYIQRHVSLHSCDHPSSAQAQSFQRTF